MLIVDDELAITSALQSYFEVQGFTVDVAAARDEALALLESRPYKVIIADLRLTGTSGDEGLEVIRAARRCNSEAAVILLTAYRTADLERRAEVAGASVLLQKPKPLPEIDRTIRSLMPDTRRMTHA